MIAIDTNILIYAHRRDSPWHEAARTAVSNLVIDAIPWAIPWPAIHEFLGNVTNRRIYRDPTPPDRALEQIDIWMQAPGMVLLGETTTYWQTLSSLVSAGNITGPVIHDARIAAICLDHDVEEPWTNDQDFERFPALVTRNPLTSPA